jgi:type VI secretion system protein ImpH
LPDRQSKFRLVLGPLEIGRYLRFTPNGADLPRLVAWVRAFVGFEFAWDLELRVHADSAPSARLEEGPRLGWSTWLGDAAWGAARHGGPLGEHAVGLVFAPEACTAGQAIPSAAMPHSS